MNDLDEMPELPAVIEQQPQPLARVYAPMTPAQARVDAVAALTTAALSKAGTLQLTQEETERLTAEFPDADFLSGAGGKENLIYIQHSALRSRLNSVLGLGQWALIVRESWNEDFKTGKGVDGVRVYVRGMMLVRGCYVGESVGDMDYYPSNGQQNYGDAFEGAKTAAFRRCAKEFGVGVQAWDKHWCEAWWSRKRNGARPAAPAPQAARAPAPAPNPKAVVLPTPRAMTPAERKDMLLAKLKGFEPEATKVFIEEGIVMENETFADIGLTTIERMTPDQMLALIKTVKQRRAEADQLDGAEVALQPHEDPRGEDAGVADPVGTVEQVNSIDGKTKAGKAWVKYGVRISGEWFNTFSKTIYDTAAALKGEQVRYTFNKTNFGNDLLTVEATSEVIP